MFRYSFNALWLGLCLGAAQVQANYEYAVELYNAKNLAGAFKEFKSAAEMGDLDAQYNLAAMYYRGEHAQRSVVDAYAWFAMASVVPAYAETNLHVRIYEKLSASEKKQADVRYSSLQEKYSRAAIQKAMVPSYVGMDNQIKHWKIVRNVAPQYPAGMLRSGLSGVVDLTFSIDKDGITRDHIVTYASNPAFSKSAIAALRERQYQPAIINDKAVVVTGIKTRYSFSILTNENNKKQQLEIIDKEIAKSAESASNGSGSEKLSHALLLSLMPSVVQGYELADNPNRWLQDAAETGNPIASYLLGHNTLFGNMCDINTAQSQLWLIKAAEQNVADAQYLLAMESFNGVNFEKNDDKGFFWLAKAAAALPAAKARYAYILATHPEDARRNNELAANLMQEIKERDFADKQTYYQTLAAIAANLGDFKKAVDMERKALADAKKLDIPSASILARLASYSAHKPWREEL